MLKRKRMTNSKNNTTRRKGQMKVSLTMCLKENYLEKILKSEKETRNTNKSLVLNAWGLKLKRKHKGLCEKWKELTNITTNPKRCNLIDLTLKSNHIFKKLVRFWFPTCVGILPSFQHTWNYNRTQLQKMWKSKGQFWANSRTKTFSFGFNSTRFWI